jgi:hypothetical protein
MHAFFGYGQTFSKATYACDLYMPTQEQMQSEFRETVLRTRALNEQHTADLAIYMITKTDCGINQPCTSFNDLMYYHLSCNDRSDVIHDLLEGSDVRSRDMVSVSRPKNCGLGLVG